MKVWLDDQPDIRGPNFPKEEGWIHTRWPEETIELLKTGQVEVLSLDHDLGEDVGYTKPRTGYDVMLWLEEQAKTNPQFVPPKHIQFHTNNAVGRQKMKISAQQMYKAYWKRIGDPRAN